MWRLSFLQINSSDECGQTTLANSTVTTSAKTVPAGVIWKRAVGTFLKMTSIGCNEKTHAVDM